MSALEAVSQMDMPQWCIGAGVIRTIVFDHLDGGTKTPIRDVDVAYFNPADISARTDRHYEGRLKARMPRVPWEVTNQAGVHLWYHRMYGYRVPPLNDIVEAVSTWPETCTAVAVTKRSQGAYKIIAPFGLRDLFAMVVRRNPTRVDVRTYNNRVAAKRYGECWRSVQIIEAQE